MIPTCSTQINFLFWIKMKNVIITSIASNMVGVYEGLLYAHRVGLDSEGQ